MHNNIISSAAKGPGTPVFFEQLETTENGQKHRKEDMY